MNMRNATCVGIQTTKVPTRASDLALYFLFCALTQLTIMLMETSILHPTHNVGLAYFNLEISLLHFCDAD